MKLSHRERDRLRSKRRYIENREMILERNRKWWDINGRMKRYHRRRKLKCIIHYSKGKMRCSCCGEKNYEFLTIHHVNANGSKHREEIKRKYGIYVYQWLINNNFPPGYDVLCMNCNFSLGKYNYCPHKRGVLNGRD